MLITDAVTMIWVTIVQSLTILTTLLINDGEAQISVTIVPVVAAHLLPQVRFAHLCKVMLVGPYQVLMVVLVRW